jgi:tetratricopeptide (TPR) repeat protein
MRASQGVVAAFAFLLAVATQAREPELGALRSYALPGYTLVAPDEVAARKVAAQVANTVRVLSAMLKRDLKAPAAPVLLLMVPRDDLHRYLNDNSHSAPAAVPRSFSNYLLLPSDADDHDLQMAIYHQATHLFLLTQFNEEFPLWFDEGLSLLMETMKVEGSDAAVGRRRFVFPKGPLQTELLTRLMERPRLEPRNGPDGWIALDRLLRCNAASPELQGRDAAYLVRRQSWALVHKALIAEPELGSQVASYFKAVNSFTPIDQAVQQSFGMNVSELDDKLFRYTWREDFEISKIHFEAPATPSLGAGNAIGRDRALQTLATLMLDAGANLRRVDEVINAAAKHSADAAELQMLRMRLAVQNRDDLALGKLLRALDSKLDARGIAAGAGLALFERVSPPFAREPENATTRDFSVRAIELLDRSLRAEPDNPEAAFAFGMLAARLVSHLDLALERLQRASERVPKNADLALAMAQVHEARSDTKQMVEQLTNVMRFTRYGQQRWLAAQRIDKARSKEGI